MRELRMLSFYKHTLHPAKKSATLTQGNMRALGRCPLALNLSVWWIGSPNLSLWFLCFLVTPFVLWESALYSQVAADPPQSNCGKSKQIVVQRNDVNVHFQANLSVVSH